MKFRMERQEVAGEHTREGITVPVTKTRHVKVPVLPRSWDTIAVRFAVGLVLALTALAICWSTWSIGSLLGGGLVAYGAAVIFDMAWAVCLVLEYLARFDAAKRGFPNRLGWGLLVATMGAIFWHGMNAGNLGMAVGGAAVSFFAKILWLGVMHHVHRELTPEDAQWVAHQISAANAKMAIADARRNASRIEQRAALELLAMERDRAAMAEAFGLPVPDTFAPGAPAADAVAPAPQDAAQAVAPAAQAALPAGITPEQLTAVLAMLGVNGQAAPGAPAPEQAEQEADVYDGEEDQEEEILPALEPPTLRDLSKADAVRIALARRPEHGNGQIADLLAAYGVETTADYVRQVRNRDRAAQAREDGGEGEVVHLRKA